MASTGGAQPRGKLFERQHLCTQDKLLCKAPDFNFSVKRFVTSQYQRDRYQRRADEEVWSVYRKPLTQVAVLPRLKPAIIKTPEFEYQFERAFNNAGWHILETVSLDYSREEMVRERATKVLGLGAALSGNEEVEKVYLLLGRPRTEAYQKAYANAKHLMAKIPLDHQLVEEDEAERFARELAVFMDQHRNGG